MEEGRKKKGNEIDEEYLMSMMAGGVRKDGLQADGSVAAQEEKEERQQPKKQSKRLQPDKDNYEVLFFSTPESNARSGKSVYIRPEFHERLTRIVQVIGEDRISLYAYLDNVLAHHFTEFEEQIKKSFDDKYKPIF